MNIYKLIRAVPFQSVECDLLNIALPVRNSISFYVTESESDNAQQQKFTDTKLQTLNIFIFIGFSMVSEYNIWSVES